MDGCILIVDDEKSTAFLLEKNPTELGNGYEVATAGAGEETLTRLVITNLHMPGVDGLELLAQARVCYPEACLILMTAHDDAQTKAAARQLGARYCFVKPFPVENLMAVIRRVLAESDTDRAGTSQGPRQPDTHGSEDQPAHHPATGWPRRQRRSPPANESVSPGAKDMCQRLAAWTTALREARRLRRELSAERLQAGHTRLRPATA
jgi:DNA-binding response OmpR family regulator